MTTKKDNTQKRLFAEWFGTLALVATVVGSGIMAETLANGNIAGSTGTPLQLAPFLSF